MAILKNMWMRGASQTLGGVVLYTLNGQTIARELAPQVSNPRTDAQMEQRVKLANLVAFYRASAGWMRGAFETKSAKQTDYNAFVATNAAKNNVWLTKSQVAAGTCIVAPYTISRGSLGEVKQTLSNGLIASNLYIGDLTIGDTTTVGALSAALLEYNNGILVGDQLSLIQYIQNVSTDNNYTIVCRAREMIIDPESTELLSKYMPISILVSAPGTNPALAVSADSWMGGAAFILSRTQGSRILVSTSSVTLTQSRDVYNAMTTTSQKQTAVKSYGENTIVFLDSNIAQDENNNVYTPLQLVQLLDPADKPVTQDGRLPLLSDGDTITVVFNKPIDKALFEGGTLDYNGQLTPTTFYASEDQPNENSIVLVSEDDVRNPEGPEGKTFEGVLTITYDNKTFNWRVSTQS